MVLSARVGGLNILNIYIHIYIYTTGSHRVALATFFYFVLDV